MAATMNLAKDFVVQVPKGGDKVYKDECVYCFDSPVSPDGLYVCLSSLLGLCFHHVKLHVNKRGKSLFLHLKKIAKEKDASSEEPPPEKKPTRMAFGVEGGFDVEQDQIEYDDINAVCAFDYDGKEIFRASLPNNDLPLQIQVSITAVLTHQGASMQTEVAAWDGEKRIISKHAETLVQMDNGVKVSPRGWQCAMCDKTDNLWMNLTDGTILCGRRYFDGSGGNNHAVEYYQNTKYPLAVKLGTITPDGADVYSYEEDDMVDDPHLAKHLLHFGINISEMQKTDKTMTELEIEANMSLKAEWDTIQEAGKKLVPLYGPGYTGMINLGNSCYMNSVMQVLFSTPEFINRYASLAENLFRASEGDPTQNFEVQMSKLGFGLLSGKYAETPTEEGEEPQGNGIRPQMFKALVGQGHAEFCSNRQQDSQEFFMHLMTLIERNERAVKDQASGRDSSLKDQFAFEFEDRIQCTSSSKVKYSRREDISWVLPIPLEAATNQKEYEAFEQRRKDAEARKEKMDSSELVRPRISLLACIEAATTPEHISDFYSSASKCKTTAKKTTRFASFPDYFVLQMRKFTVGDDWVPKKLDVSLDVPDVLNLDHLRGSGLQPEEEELPEEKEPQPEPEINVSLVNQLVEMGFDFEGCKKAVYHTNNVGVEEAMNWVLEHMGDPDFGTPLALSTSNKNQGSAYPDDNKVAMITSMGFTREQAIKALKATGDNVERAADWIFSHLDELETMQVDEEPAQAPGAGATKYRDGPGNYELFAFISHMGTSTSCGHYVCHILKEGKWVIYNDRKVAISETPPRDLAYIYFYRRIES